MHLNYQSDRPSRHYNVAVAEYDRYLFIIISTYLQATVDLCYGDRSVVVFISLSPLFFPH